MKDIGTMSDSTTLALDDSEPLQAHKAASEPSTGLEWTGTKSQTLRGFGCSFNALNLTFNRTAVGANDFLRNPDGSILVVARNAFSRPEGDSKESRGFHANLEPRSVSALVL